VMADPIGQVPSRLLAAPPGRQVKQHVGADLGAAAICRIGVEDLAPPVLEE
jgi:hypothetical protein